MYQHPILKRVSLQRTMCYGPCPVYHVAVTGDGEVGYHGDHFVAVEGRHKWKTTKRRLTALVKAIEKAHYFGIIWGDDVGGYVTDQPSAITSVEFHDGRSRRIDHYYGDLAAPDELTKLEATIDRLAGTAAYVKGNKQQNQLLPLKRR